MKRLFVLFFLMACASVFADKKAALGGMDGFVERMATGGRELGRGNIGAADTSAMPSVYFNPALLAFRSNVGYALAAEKRDLDRAGGSLGIESSVGKRMGIGAAVLYRTDLDFEVINSDDETVGSAQPYFTTTYIGVGYRLTRKDGIGFSLAMSYDNLDISGDYEDADLVDSYQSPVVLNLGWHREWNEHWSTAVVIRNLSFSKNLSAKWTRNASNDNSVEQSEGVRPKVLQIGLGYHTKLLERPISVWMEALDYQVADTLLVFDPDWHIWTGRFGMEWEALENLIVRGGFDEFNYTFGLGYKFSLRLGKRKYFFQIDYALVYESQAELWNPLSFGFRGWL
ncbi:hypothetical protein [Hallerella succinigenes]|uniref:PorV/PorQ family protein n=1 Tax=Hallerella succinigenes TaxID=1896222 RepID=A0A2M9A579_9BACT|nr:hypothetical protein [Hallerella succinigenes]PJJ40872.1 hypothetical protein BGX16_0823 [Hallerella succinigenes]